MNENCKSFRMEWLFSGVEPEHAEACRACRSWMASALGREEVLRGLTPLMAPPELDLLVEAELAGTSTRRLESVLTSLVRFPAPARLDDLVRRRLGERGDPARGEVRAGALASLDIHGAPDVLERLLREELESPEAARVDRFAGNIERLKAPDLLGERLALKLRRRTALRTVLPPLVSLAAAVMVVLLTLRSGEDSESDQPRQGYSFEVVRASSLQGLDPMARQLGLLFGGSDLAQGAGPR